MAVKWNPSTVPVAVHYRGGDIAYENVFLKRQPMVSTVLAMLSVQRLLLPLGYAPHFFIYSQRPNGANESQTAEYFQPIQQAAVEKTLLLDSDAAATFHALITAPILLGSGSGFTTMATLMRSGVSVSIRPSCIHSVMLHNDGTFDEESFLAEFQEYTTYNDPTRWWTFEQCDALPYFPQPSDASKIYNMTYAQLNYTTRPEEC